MSKAIIDLKEMANKEDQLFRAAPLSRANDLHNSTWLYKFLRENALENLNKYFPHNCWQEIHPPIETPYTTNSCANGPLFRGIHPDPAHLPM